MKIKSFWQTDTMEMISANQTIDVQCKIDNSSHNCAGNIFTFFSARIVSDLLQYKCCLQSCQWWSSNISVFLEFHKVAHLMRKLWHNISQVKQCQQMTQTNLNFIKIILRSGCVSHVAPHSDSYKLRYFREERDYYE